jgi:hypothetical protein
LSNTYSIEKDNTLFTVDRNIFDSDLDVFQFSFVIFNLKNDSNMKTGITETDGKNVKRSLSIMGKSIDIKGRLSDHNDINNKKYSLKQWEDSNETEKKEAKKFRNYLPTPFIEKSIITIRYNPKEDTVEYWCDNKQINYVSKIYNNVLQFF